MRLQARLVVCALTLLGAVGVASAHAQTTGRAEANQLHAAITNGDLESLRYWLDVRHADPAAPNETEPDLTPIGRCVRMAARVLDAPTENAQPVPTVGLRVLQDMVVLLHQHKAQLTASERQRFPGPALRWYDDAVSTPPKPSAEKKPQHDSGESAVQLLSTAVVVTQGQLISCHGTGHLVYLTNRIPLSIVATVEIVEDPNGPNPTRQIDAVIVDAEGIWELGCNVSKAGRPVTYVLKSWR